MSVLIQHLFQQFKMSLLNSTTAKLWLKEQGIHPTKCGLGYMGKKFHHQKDSGFVEQCVLAGMLVPARLDGLAPKVKNAVMFPLYNHAGSIVNCWLYGFEKDESAFVNEHRGYFPKLPDERVETLYLVDGILSSARMMSDYRGETEGVLAVMDTVDFVEIGPLPNLKTVYVADTLSEEVTSSIKDYLDNTRPDVTVFSFDKNFTVEVPEPVQEEEVPESDGEQDLIIVHPHKRVMASCFGGYFEVLGSLPKDLGNLKITLHYTTDNGRKYRGKPDLFEREHIDRYIKGLSAQEHVPEQLIEHDLLRLTSLLENMREEEYTEQTEAFERSPREEFTPERKSRAVEMLSDSSLIERIHTLLGDSGIVGEEETRLALFLVALSYKFPAPLHAIVTASSGSGKSALINGIADCLPGEDVISISRMSAKSLFHFGEDDLVKKVVVIQDLDGLPREALYGLRELQSYHVIRSSVTRKDKYGNLTTNIKTVKGQFSSMSATTRDAFYDNDSRSLNFQVDESAEQTKRINGYLAQVASGRASRQKEEEAKRTLADMVRALEPRETINPLAEHVQLPAEVKGQRRLTPMFGAFVSIVANLHQHQRKQDERGNVMATVEDIRYATRIFFGSLLLRSDDMNGSLRQFFERLKTYLGNKPHGVLTTFTQREIRLAFGLSKAHTSRFLAELRALEYIAIVGGYKNRMYVYSLSYQDDYQKLREEIQKNLEQQIDALETPS